MTYLAEKIHLKVQANTRFVQSSPSENIVQSVRNYGIIQNLFQRMVLTDLAYFLDWPPESPDNQYHLNK